jgi:hypothetical protein
LVKYSNLIRPLRLAVRISGSHPEDRGFESRRGHHISYVYILFIDFFAHACFIIR